MHVSEKLKWHFAMFSNLTSRTVDFEQELAVIVILQGKYNPVTSWLHVFDFFSASLLDLRNNF